MGKPPLNRKSRVIPPDSYDPDPPTPESLADWAPIDDRLKLSETSFSYHRTTDKNGVTTTVITAARRTASVIRRIGIPQLPPRNWKDALVGGVASLLTVISLGKMVAAYMAEAAISMTDPILAGAGGVVLAVMTVAGRRK